MSPFAAATNYGFATPGQNTARSLVHVSLALMAATNTLDSIVAIKLMQLLSADVSRSFVKTQRALERKWKRAGW